MNLFCLIFGHSPQHPKTQLFCHRRCCNYKFPGYCEHKWKYEEHKRHEDIAGYDIGRYVVEYFSNLKCDKCGVRKFSMEYEKYLTGEWN